MSRFISPPQNILDSEVVLPAGTMTILSLAVGQSTGTYSISISCSAGSLGQKVQSRPTISNAHHSINERQFPHVGQSKALKIIRARFSEVISARVWKQDLLKI
jgi:hypothetical protein